jgi:hypothetical protein
MKNRNQVLSVLKAQFCLEDSVILEGVEDGVQILYGQGLKDGP